MKWVFLVTKASMRAYRIPYKRFLKQNFFGICEKKKFFQKGRKLFKSNKKSSYFFTITCEAFFNLLLFLLKYFWHTYVLFWAVVTVNLVPFWANFTVKQDFWHTRTCSGLRDNIDLHCFFKDIMIVCIQYVQEKKKK